MAVVAAQPSAERPLSAEEVARLEAKHLQNIRQVTFGFFRAGEGYFRPDGKAIIFQAVPNLPTSVFLSAKPNQYEYQIFTCDLAPDAKPLLVSTGLGACTCAFFHPDGKSIIFGSTHLNPSPTAPRTAYSRSGSRYRWSFPEGMDIFKADLDGKNLVRLTDADGYDAEGSYSPDGKQIVFTSFRDGDADIYIMDADGKNARRVVQSKGYDGGPFFSPDGKRIIYRSDRKGNDLLQIYVNNTDRNRRAGAHEQRLRELGAVLASRQHPHRLFDQPSRPLELRGLHDERRYRRRGADHLPRRLRRSARVQP